MKHKKVVTRFAPSPTGFMHIGSIRTAMYAWLYARKHNGTFILRIEDTDKEREVEGATEHIQESLTWMGLLWDQGPIKQSERLDIYIRYAKTLANAGLAYPDPYTEEEVEGFRSNAESEKRPFLFRDHRPNTILPWDGKEPLRFRVPDIRRYVWHDIVRGELSAGEEALDDFILIKADGYPTYNFAHVVDDIEMGVTHVMRGEEFISSTPRFLSLYDALHIDPPQIVTMPIILGPDGHKKLSKRDNAKDVLEYKKEGYLPSALFNFLSLLGWHPESDQEIMSVSEIMNYFTLERIQKGGAKFDDKKLIWFNHEHIRKLSNADFIDRLVVFLKSRDQKVPEYLHSIAEPLKERSHTLMDAALAILPGGEFSFFENVGEIQPELLLRGANADAETVKKHLDTILHMLQDLPDDDFSSKKIKEILFPYATKEGRSAVLWPMRVALSGMEKSPDPFVVAGALGKKTALERIAVASMVL